MFASSRETLKLWSLVLKERPFEKTYTGKEECPVEINNILDTSLIHLLSQFVEESDVWIQT